MYLTTEVGTRSVLTASLTNILLAYHIEVIQAAGHAGLNIIPLAWTLLIGNQTLAGTAVPKIKAVTQVDLRFLFRNRTLLNHFVL